MSKAEMCPVCQDTGKYKEYSNYTNCIYIEKTCHGCNGKGWIEVGGRNEQSRRDV